MKFYRLALSPFQFHLDITIVQYMKRTLHMAVQHDFPPRCRLKLRALGVRGFSIAQLPVTLEDIDAVWERADAVKSSEASDRSHDEGETGSASDEGILSDDAGSSLHGSTALSSTLPTEIRSDGPTARSGSRDVVDSTASGSTPPEGNGYRQKHQGTGSRTSDGGDWPNSEPFGEVDRSQAGTNAVEVLSSAPADPPAIDCSTPGDEPAGGGSTNANDSSLTVVVPPARVQGRDCAGDGGKVGIGSVRQADAGNVGVDTTAAQRSRGHLSPLQKIDDRGGDAVEGDDFSGGVEAGNEDTSGADGSVCRTRNKSMQGMTGEESTVAENDSTESSKARGGEEVAGKLSLSATSRREGGITTGDGTASDNLDETVPVVARDEENGPEEISRDSPVGDRVENGKMRVRETVAVSDAAKSSDKVTPLPTATAIDGTTVSSDVDPAAVVDPVAKSGKGIYVQNTLLGRGSELSRDGEDVDTSADGRNSTISSAEKNRVGITPAAGDAEQPAAGEYDLLADITNDQLELMPRRAVNQAPEVLETPCTLPAERQREDQTRYGDACRGTPAGHGTMRRREGEKHDHLTSSSGSNYQQVDDTAVTTGARGGDQRERKGDEAVYVTAMAEDARNTAGNDDIEAHHSSFHQPADFPVDEIAHVIEEAPATSCPDVCRIPRFFEASVVLLTAKADEQDIKCVVECGIETTRGINPSKGVALSPETLDIPEINERIDSATTVKHQAPSSCWRGAYCVYKFYAQEVLSPSKIDLEDDDAQDRLENLLQTFDLSLEDVLGRFPVGTDLARSSAVIDAFTESICHLQRSCESSASGTAEDKPFNRTRSIRTAVEIALLGTPEWVEVHAAVENGRVLEVNIVKKSEAGE